MILRQFCARHGRTVLAQSTRSSLNRSYATSLPDDNPSSSPATTFLEQMIDSQKDSISSLQADVKAYTAAKTSSTPPLPTATDSLRFQNLKELNQHRRGVQKSTRGGTQLSETYDPSTILRRPFTTDQLTLPLLLANQTHLGHHTSLWHPSNSGYIYGVRDEIHIISLDITYAYLKRAAKVVQAVARKGGIILFIGTRKGMEEIVVNSARLARGYHIFHRWVPGSLTNGQQILGDAGVKVVDIYDNHLKQYDDLFSGGSHQAMRPDLVVCLNPLENQVCLHECGVFNVPTIGIVDTDVNPTWVTYPIPANDDSFRSVALIAGVLGKAGEEGQRLRKTRADEKGEATYDTSKIMDKLLALEELAALRVDHSQGSTGE